MENETNLIESLLERVTEYGQSNYELAKLKVVDKTADVVSSFIPHSVVFVLISSFILFVNFGLAIWLGEVFGKLYYGFFAVAIFYGLIGLFIHFFLHNWIKKSIGNSFVKQMLK